LVGDDLLARRYVEAGFRSAEAVDSVFGRLGAQERDELLSAVESYHRLGSAIRNLRTGAERISALVHSLRSYGRKPGETVSDLDVVAGLEETLLLLGHRLGDIVVERDYREVAPIAGHPGELNQVWTNLIVNAIDVMGGSGVLSVVVRPSGGDVVVEIIDSGPGISPEHMDRIFEMEFTTKQGRVDFGLGLGLRIALDIVERHGGHIDVDSKPGRTCFAVTLPRGGNVDG
jgi:signal transduction histidine kinase